MYKIFALLQRAPDTDWYAFRNILREDIPRALRQIPPGKAINRIEAFNVLERDFRPTTNADNHQWSGVLGLHFDSREEALAAAQDDVFIGALSARSDMVSDWSISVVREVPVSEEDDYFEGSCKVFAFFTNTLPKDNPMSREEMFNRWNEHAGRMQGARLDQLMNKFTQNQVLPDFHAANPRYDYDGVSEIWFPSVEKGELLFKNYDAEQTIIPSSAQMDGEPGGCVYLRTDEFDAYRRAD